jgi:hypothetical protein
MPIAPCRSLAACSIAARCAVCITVRCAVCRRRWRKRRQGWRRRRSGWQRTCRRACHRGGVNTATDARRCHCNSCAPLPLPLVCAAATASGMTLQRMCSRRAPQLWLSPLVSCHQTAVCSTAQEPFTYTFGALLTASVLALASFLQAAPGRGCQRRRRRRAARARRLPRN